jgi:pilus assembly protein CpaB
MRIRSLLLLGIAILLAAATALFAREWLNAQRQTLTAGPVPGSEKPVLKILVARQSLAAGRILNATDLSWQAWPDDLGGQPYLVAGTHKPEDFTGAVVRLPLVVGEPITPDRLVMPGDRSFLAAVLRPGMRAASVAVTAISGISGFIFPGDRVDILLTHVLPAERVEGAVAPQSRVERHATETVLRNLRVLAIDQKIENKASEVIIAHTATLEVTDKQSETLALIAEMGKLTLSLRSLANEDSSPLEDSGQSAMPSYTLDSEASHLLAAPERPDRSPTTEIRISVLHGGKGDDFALKKAR